MKFIQEWNTWQKVNGKFGEDWAKTYALIYVTYCTSEMRTAIIEDPKFETEIRDEPLRVLEAIITFMYTHVRARYPYSTLAETLISLFNIRKIQDENLVDFIERFNQEKQLVKTQLKKHFLNVFVGNTVEYNASTEEVEKTSMKSGAFEQFMPIFFLRSSDQGKYGKMQDNYCMDYANKKDNYPKSVVDMVDIMKQVKISRKKTSPDKGKSKIDKKKNLDVKSKKYFVQQKGDGIIYNFCRKPGELASNCPLK